MRYRPASALSPDLLADLQALKPELIELLSWPEVSLDYLERFQVPELELLMHEHLDVAAPPGAVLFFQEDGVYGIDQPAQNVIRARNREG